jgi:hypothetical protein
VRGRNREKADIQGRLRAMFRSRQTDRDDADEVGALFAQLNAAVAARDEAIAERDYILKLFTDMGMALGKSVKLTLKVTKHGVEARVLYRTADDAMAAYAADRVVRAMLSFAPRPTDAAHDICCAVAEAHPAHA